MTFFLGTSEEYEEVDEKDKVNLLALITDDTSKEDIEGRLTALEGTVEGNESSLSTLEESMAELSLKSASADSRLTAVETINVGIINGTTVVEKAKSLKTTVYFPGVASGSNTTVLAVTGPGLYSVLVSWDSWEEPEKPTTTTYATIMMTVTSLEDKVVITQPFYEGIILNLLTVTRTRGMVSVEAIPGPNMAGLFPNLKLVEVRLITEF